MRDCGRTPRCCLTGCPISAASTSPMRAPPAHSHSSGTPSASSRSPAAPRRCSNGPCVQAVFTKGNCPNEQGDAQEFLSFDMDRMHDERQKLNGNGLNSKEGMVVSSSVAC
ncbi:hypothetical protein U9M48_043638 [Paspalum notatum var. saurae]|uniref:Uncharacterized protein n=1 Tax=Paspalum notatum var. saurae TaxID=547442 RepID=A0AAQ3UZP6_PASNO